MRFAAIDIGTNAVRLLFTQVFEGGKNGPIFKKDALFRVPIRLGEDVFTNQRISVDKADSLVQTMIGFKHLMAAYRPLDYMACATSAMREAENGSELAHAIKRQADIDLEVVDGKREAEIIYSNHISDMLSHKNSYLYIDVGGGSTEITLIERNQIVTSHSFNLGTVRILKEMDKAEEWKSLKTWLKETCPPYQPIEGIGSGGNINKLFNLSRREFGRPLPIKKLKSLYKWLNSYTFEERIKVLGMRPDRADVIIPASRLFLSVMQWGSIKRIYVPQIGLSDGIIHLLYEKHRANQQRPAASLG